MSDIEIRGLRPLSGQLKIQGSKNGVLPMMAAAILNKEAIVIENVPRIQDVFCMMGILDSLGCGLSLEGNRLTVDASGIHGFQINREDMGKMRSSIMLLGPLLGRMGQAAFFSPGGCSIGERPIDLHRTALKQMGVRFQEQDGMIEASCERLSGACVAFPFPSVGATENVVMAAVLAQGETVLRGAAKEPEIMELCEFLNACGAKIEGIGTDTIRITGVEALHGCIHRAEGDRIVAGTYLMAAAASRGSVTLEGVAENRLQAACHCLRQMGAEVESEGTQIVLKARKRLAAVQVSTGPYPSFPTDLQSPLMALCCTADGESVITENVFEGRFKTAEQLGRLGASIGIQGNRAAVRGRQVLVGGRVEATDLRGGAALVVAGMSAAGITYIGRRDYIDRGYEDIVRDLRILGAEIKG